MLIKEVSTKSRLTKKAIAYYEAQGLLTPKFSANGYRDYSQEDVARLQEIAVLRKCGLSISAIRTVLDSTDKKAALVKYQYVAKLQQQRQAKLQAQLAALSEEYDITKAFAALAQQDDALFTVQEKLVLAFPGNFGLYLALYFGRFLTESLQTMEQQRAYRELITYLDSVSLEIPAELSEYLQAALASDDIEVLVANTQNAVQQALDDPNPLLEKEETAAYLAYRLLSEYQNSPAGRLTEIMVIFQKSSGYQTKLLDNLKIISPSYQKYSEQLATANAAFLQKFPQAAKMFTDVDLLE